MGWSSRGSVTSFLGVLLVILLSAPLRVAIGVRPRVGNEGQPVVVECMVPKDDRNRLIELGIVLSASSARDMEGSNSPLVYRQQFMLPCLEDVKAYCRLTRTDHVWLAEAPLTVVCNDVQH